MRNAAVLALLALFTLSCSSGNEPASNDEAVLQVESPELLEQASVSEAEARSIALEASDGGTIVEAELEQEGDLLLYSFEIRLDDGGLMDVEVDASSGEVLEAELDEDDDDDEDEDDDEHDDGEGNEQSAQGS